MKDTRDRKEYFKQWYQRNRDKILKHQKEYNSNNLIRKREYDLSRKHIRKEHAIKCKEYILNYLKDKSCVHCGSDSGGICNGKKRHLHFHHIDPATKSFSIGVRTYYKIDISLLQEEINKCILLCSHCHRQEHKRLNLISKNNPI